MPASPGANGAVPEHAAIQAGPYRGALPPELRAPELLAKLADMPALLRKAKPLAHGGRNQLAVAELPLAGGAAQVAIKVFGRQAPPKDWIDFSRGSKACRSWLAAAALHKAGVGTPAPVGYLDRWQGRRLLESYYLSIFEENLTCFRDELNRLYREDPVCEKIMGLMQTAADAIWAMHEAGVVHNDLGNQNIALRRTGEQTWGDVQFVDLNRARIRDSVSLQERARDISRIDLPSDFLRVFKIMYFQRRNPPPAFERWEARYRRQFAFHTWTRQFRHPLRTRLRRQEERKHPLAPRGRDLWVWDGRSAQAISTLRRKDRKKFYSFSNTLHIARAIPSLAPVAAQFQRLKKECFEKPVEMAGRVGMAVDPSPAHLEQELQLLAGLGRIPVFLRFYHHETEALIDFRIQTARRLRAAGHPVSIALVQDRQAVLQPNRWARFCARILSDLQDAVEWVEVGHAINRVKWGVWRLDEYLKLLKPAADAARAFPHLKLMGPACIDFEYHYLAGLLRMLPKGFRFQALSHHLYVDRRGAPENRQGPFSAEEKFALARAIAAWTPACEPRLIVSETNWPLLGTGVYSPVGSPYEAPGPRANDPSATEDDYADFMIRYLAIALCSGMVERVYWWRLVARGFGLVDDTAPNAWRARPAYDMLKTFLSLLSGGAYEARLPSPEGCYALRFRRPGRSALIVAWSAAGPQDWKPPFDCEQALDAFGRKINTPTQLTGRPIFLAARGAPDERIHQGAASSSL